MHAHWVCAQLERYWCSVRERTPFQLLEQMLPCSVSSVHDQLSQGTCQPASAYGLELGRAATMLMAHLDLGIMHLAM